jgi:hypothetical protein
MTAPVAIYNVSGRLLKSRGSFEHLLRAICSCRLAVFVKCEVLGIDSYDWTAVGFGQRAFTR